MQSNNTGGLARILKAYEAKEKIKDDLTEYYQDN
jgi:hypothetical protein